LLKLNQGLSNPHQAGASEGSDDAVVPTQEPSMTPLSLNVSVRERAPARVAYLRHVGPYGASVAAFWQQRFYPFMAQHQLLGRPNFGVSHDDPKITAPEKCRYDTFVVVDPEFVARGDTLITTIPGGLYAELPFMGTPAEIGSAWTALMRDWLPASGYQIDGRPTFEYDAPGAIYDEATCRFQCDIVIPLAPLQGVETGRTRLEG